jgi:hypothetical protein
MVPVDVRPETEAFRFEDGTKPIDHVQIGHGDLDVDHVLRGDARDRGRADVVDLEGDVAEGGPHASCNLPELNRPGLVVRDVLDAHGS